MSMNISRIGVAELAELLEDRKSENQNVALILGSRAGALSRSEGFVDAMALSSKSMLSFVDKNERERFSECYTLLQIEKAKPAIGEIERLLKEKTRDINSSMADSCIAELVEQKVFKLILTTNADDLLYDAFTTLGLKEKQNFVDFDLGRLSITDTIDEILSYSYEKRNACKILKFYGDIGAFVHRLDKTQMQKEISQGVKTLLERMKIKEILIVGIDLTWDEMILSALPARLETIWFVNEDERVKDAFYSLYQRAEDAKFITGQQGSSEKFFKALYWQINPGIPPLTSQLQKQLNMMQLDLVHIKERLKSLEEHSHEQASIDILKNTESPSYTSNEVSADVLLITVTDIEARAVFDLFPNKSKRVINGRIYYDLSIVGSARTFMAQSTGVGSNRARTCIEASVQALSPQVVIMVGVAFGLYPEKQKMGDILVSQQIEDYDQQKIGTGLDGQRKIYARGDRVQASERLLNRFIAGRYEWQFPPAVHFGLILSGSILISNESFRDELHRAAPDAIGGEMEGTSLYEVGSRRHVEWILVKAICDWADAGKNDAHQILAARNAARFVIQVVSQEQFVNRR